MVKYKLFWNIFYFMYDILFDKVLRYEFIDALREINKLEAELDFADFRPYIRLKVIIFFEFSNYQNTLVLIDDYINKIELSPLFIELNMYKTLSKYELGVEIDVISELNTYFDKLNEFEETMHLSGLRGDLLMYIGLQYLITGSFEEAIKNFDRSLDYYMISDRPIEKSRVISYISFYYLLRGELKKSLKYQQNAINMIETEYPLRMSYGYNNLGLIYNSIGDLDKAYTNFKMALELFLKNGKINKTSVPLSNLGVILLDKGEYAAALNKFQNALEIDSKFQNNYILAESYYYIIIIHLEMGNIKLAKKIFEDFSNIASRSNNLIVEQRYDIANALLLKQSKRYRDKARSEEILENVVNGKMLDFIIHVEAVFNLCNLLLEELQTTGEAVILAEINDLLDTLLIHAEQENSHIITIKVYLIKSQLYLIKLDIVRAKEFLDMANNLSEIKNFKLLDKKISMLYDDLLSIEEEWQTQDAVSVTERIKSLNLSILFDKIIYSSVETSIIKEENPALILIMSRDGSRIYSNDFNSPVAISEDLASGLMTVIFSLSQDLFKSKPGSLQRIKQDKYTVLTKAKSGILFSYAFQGPSYHAHNKLELLIKTLHDSKKIWEIMTRSNYVMNNNELKAFDELVADIFYNS